MRLLVNALLIEVGWYVCVVLGNVAALFYLACALVVHFSYVSRSFGEVRFVLLVAILGISVDTLLMHLGVFQWPDQAILIPFWLIALWVLFSMSFNHCLKWLRQKPWLALVLGMLFGPANYIAGIKLTGAVMPMGFLTTTAILMVVWMLLLPALSANRLHLWSLQGART
ncbi:DUF2878 domain-containing protein [Halieaceae bacterium]|nr:DUF2878 domain-containing protein [Halieaceae bacterium]